MAVAIELILGFFKSIMGWIFRNPLQTFALLAIATALFYRGQSSDWQEKAKKADAEAVGAKETTKQVKGREKALIALEKQQRKDGAYVETLISARRYFDSN